MRFLHTLAHFAMARAGTYSGSNEMLGGIDRRLHLAAVFLVLFTFPISATSRQGPPEHAAGSKSSPQQPKASRERQASSEVDARVSDVINLAASASPDSSRSLIAYLNDPSPLVRAAALSGLASLRDSKSVPAIAGVLEKDKDEFVRRQAAFALGGFHDPAAIPFLLKALGDKTDVKAAAIVSLGKECPCPEAIPALIASLDDKSGFIRASAARALGLNSSAAQAAVSRLIQIVDADPAPMPGKRPPERSD